MRYFLGLLAVAWLLSLGLVPAVAQDDASPSPASLLDRYLHFPAEREALRPRLLALGADALAALIRDYPRPAVPAAGEHKFETVCPDGFTRPYWVRIPKGYDGVTPAVLVVCLHGGVMAAPVDSGVAIMRWYGIHIDKRENPRPIITMAASADCYETWMNAAWWRDAGRANVLHFVRECKLRFPIDPERVFVTGFSDGGSGSFSMAFNSPDVFAGYLPMCGDPLIPITDDIMHAWSNLKGAQIHAFNGAKDPIYPGKEIEKIFKEGNKAGANIDWIIDPEATHDWGDPDIIFPRNLALIDTWTRPAVPDTIDWTADRASRREWISIDETGCLSKAANKAKKPAPREGGSYRIDLGIKVPITHQPHEKPVVGRVDQGSLAETMGVKAGDLVKSLNGQAVGSFGEIRMQLAQLRAGDEVKLVIEREGVQHTLTGTITRPAKRTVGRLEAKRAGSVTVEVHDVTKFSIWVSPGMLDAKGEISVRLNNQTVFTGKVDADPAVLLDEFTRSGEREGRYIHRIQIDVKQPKRR